MDMYSIVSPQILKTSFNHDYLKELPLNILFKFNNNSYPHLKDFPNIKILVDSGAYYFNSRVTGKTDDDLYKFLLKYIQFIEETKDDPRMMGYFDMDLSYLGLNNIKKIRKKLYKLTDKIIPVFHRTWGEREFKKMCKSYGYIGFPCSSDYTLEDYMNFVKYSHKYGCKFHGLGMDRDKIMKSVPFNSCDSAIWVRQGYMEYYANHNIPKVTKNNTHYQPIYIKREIITQYRRQEFYKNKWSNYHSHQTYKEIGETKQS